MLLVGVDEAGYGPLLGPLAVAGSAFRLPGAAPTEADELTEFGSRLARALRRGGSDGRPCLDVGDSKEVYGRGGLEALEEPLLALLGARTAEARPGAWSSGLDDFLDAVGVDPGRRRRRPWYAGELARFPLRLGPATVAERAAAARRTLDRAGFAFVGFAAEVIGEAGLNADFARTGNKADTLFRTSADVLERLLEHADDGETVCAVLDRHGGRKHYLPMIQQRWPAGFAWTLAESAHSSAYRLRLGGRRIELRFSVRADADAPQVGLASMLAKYLREVYMALWNDWFARLCPDVRPTAGYTVDGRRWLEESRAARSAAGIDDAALTRTR